jgi:hypothetical protein
MTKLLDRFSDHLTDDEKEPTGALSYEYDDGGLSTNDAAARFLRDAGADYKPGADDFMTRATRAMQSHASTAANEDFLDAAAFHHGTARSDGDVQLNKLELVLDAKRNAQRALVEKREYIKRLCKSVSDAERSRRIRNSLRMIGKGKVDNNPDFRAIIAACAYADMVALGVDAKRRINMIARNLPGENGKRGASNGTARRAINTGALLLDELRRHAVPNVAMKVSPGKCTVKGRELPNIRKAVKGSLHTSEVSIAAIARLSARDQLAVARAIERHVIDSELAAGEGIDAKAGLHKFTCAQLDMLDLAERNDMLTRRQLAKLGEHEKKRLVREMLTGKLDELSGERPDDSAVNQRASAYRSFVKSDRAAANMATRKVRRVKETA